MQKSEVSSGISERDRKGIVRLYEALVPREEIKKMDLNGIKSYFPTFEEIDVEMIIEEAFPAFETTIGEQNFAKVKRYFGIGSNPKTNSGSSKEIDSLLANLRTMENAQYYISGYKDLVSAVAKKLERAPRNLSKLEKAKIIRLYFIAFCGYYYFVEDFSYKDRSKTEVAIDFSKLQRNNRQSIYPEELFVLFVSKLKDFKDYGAFYDIIYSEIVRLDKRVLKETLSFGELEMVNKGFVSVNKVSSNQTFGSIRNLKFKIHAEPGVFPMELFVEKEMIRKLDLADLYTIYKILKVHDLETFESVSMDYKRFEGSRIIDATYNCYEIIEGIHISGEIEKRRFITMMEYYAGRGFKMTVRHDAEGKLLRRPKRYNTRLLLSSIKFANDAKYLTGFNSVDIDFQVTDTFIAMDNSGALEEYAQGLLSVQEMQERLGIDEDFEAEYFNIKRPVSHKKIITKFAIESGYVEMEEGIDEILLENVWIPGNENIIERYHSGELDSQRFEQKIGFNPEFSEMFFTVSKIDVSVIEAKLLEIKHKKIDRKWKMLILLYCYIVENEIACGPRMRIPKRNKALKPANLKKFID